MSSTSKRSRRSSMKRVISGADRAPGRKHARLLEDLVRLAEFPVLFLELGDALPFVRGGSRAGPAVDLGLADPVAERLWADVELPGDAGDHAVTLAVLVDRGEDELDRAPSPHAGTASMTCAWMPWSFLHFIGRKSP